MKWTGRAASVRAGAGGGWHGPVARAARSGGDYARYWSSDRAAIPARTRRLVGGAGSPATPSCRVVGAATGAVLALGVTACGGGGGGGGTSGGGVVPPPAPTTPGFVAATSAITLIPGSAGMLGSDLRPASGDGVFLAQVATTPTLPPGGTALTQYANSLPDLVPGVEDPIPPAGRPYRGTHIPVRLTKVRILDILLWTEIAIHGPFPHPRWRAYWQARL